MSKRAVEEREQRRGLVLGLTLAEALLLMLFLLMLALGSRMEHWRREAEQRQHSYDDLVASQESLKTIQSALMKDGSLDVSSVQQLVARLKRVDELERNLAELKSEYSSLSAQVAILQSQGPDLRKTLQVVSSALEHAHKIDPNDPPALLRRAMEILERLGPSTEPDQVRSLSEMTANSQVRQQLASTEADRDKLKQQLEGLRGNGLTYPPCWPATKGRTEYMFDVIAKDGGIEVRDAYSPARKSDPAWKYVDPFPRKTLIGEKQFNEATAKLLPYSNQNNCRYYIRLYDGTAPESKGRYIRVRAAIAANFYLYPVISSQAPTDSPASLPDAHN